MEKPILDPVLPYVGPIHGGKFIPGRLVKIQGTVPSVAYSFDINLQCGPSILPRDDTAVQVLVKLLDECIIVNSLQNGAWGEEQRHNNTPIRRAERFELIISCNYNQYEITINGRHFAEFPQKIKCEQITHLSINGDVSIIQITYESNPGVSSSGVVLINENEDFEMIDSTTNKLLSAGPSAPIGFQTDVAQPPPYGLATSMQGAPYPTSGSGGLYPTGNAPYPAVGYPSNPPYSTGGTPYPTGVPGMVGTSHLPPPGAPGIPSPAPGAPIPLNAHSSNFRTAKRNYEKTWFECLGISFIAILGIGVLLFFNYGI